MSLEQPRTLLEQLIAERDRSWPEAQREFERHARALHRETGEPMVSLTWRHLQRIASGETKRPYSATRRVLERQFGRMISDLLGPPLDPDDASPVRVACDGVGAISRPVDEADIEITIPVRTEGGGIRYVRLSRRALFEAAGMFGLMVTPVAPSFGPAPLTASPDENPISYFVKLENTLTDADNTYGPVQAIDIALQQVRVMTELRQNWRGSDRTELTVVLTQYADLVSWFYLDLRDFKNAQTWADRSLEWSHLCRDHQTTAFMLARRSQLAADMGAVGDSIDSAEAARHLARPGTRISAMSLMFAAQGYALQGDWRTSAGLFDEAHETFTHEIPDETPYGRFLNQSYLDVHRANSMVSLNRPRDAVELFEKALFGLPDGFQRDGAVYTARQARAYAAAGDIDQAATIGLRALDVGLRTGSSRLLRELAELDTALAAQSTQRSVADFRSAFTEIIPRQI